MPQPLLHALLTLTNIIFLAAVLRQVRAAASAPPEPTFPESLATPFAMLVAVSAAGLVNSAAKIVSGFVCPRGNATSARLAQQAQPLLFVVVFWAQELIWELALSSGLAIRWNLLNFSGRLRAVYPLRFVAWSSTNSYIFAALASVLRMAPRDTLIVSTVITLATFGGFPLELNAVGSLPWISVAFACVCGFIFTLISVGAHAVTLLQTEGVKKTGALFATAVAAIVSYVLFPILFFTAQICGGDGSGTCLSIATEARYWRVIECASKALVACLIIMVPFFSDAEPGLLQPRRRKVVVHQLPARFTTSVHADAAPLVGALRESLSVIIGASFLTAVCTSALIDALIAAAVGSETDSFAGVKRYSVVIVIIATFSVFVMTLDTAIYRERVRALASSFLPAGFFEDGSTERDTGVYPDDFDAAKVYSVSEPHVTLLFIDVVGFTRASLTTSSTDVMLTLAGLFRHFDQLHADAGALKIETIGDEYVSVIGAEGPSSKGTAGPPPTASEQALIGAELALRVSASLREHSWPDGKPLQARVGVHCGPAMTGVIGGSLPRWGIFGHSVVIASRLESSCEPERVQVSAEFAAALREAGDAARGFALIERSVALKGLGETIAFWLERTSSTSTGAVSTLLAPRENTPLRRKRAGSTSARRG